MTRQPWAIEARCSLLDAHELMRAHGIRHLPVIEHGMLVGIVSDRDLRMYEAVGGARSDAVRDAMNEPVFTVAPTEAVDTVARVMADRKFGSAVVVTKTGRVEGIFTAIDACRALVDVLDRATA